MCPLEDSNSSSSSDNTLVEIRDNNNAAITSTTVGSKQSLDVNVTQATAFSDSTGSGTITATDGSVTATTTGCSTASFYVTGTWVATLAIEATIDDSNYFTINGYQENNNTIISSLSLNKTIVVPCAGFKKVRIRASSYTSGTVSITWISSTASSQIIPNQQFDFTWDLLRSRAFSAASEVNQASGSVDNPLILLRNPVDNTKYFFIQKVLVGTQVTNIVSTYKIFGSPTTTSSAKTITSIVQNALSTTVTVTTSTAHGGTVGAKVVITGTTNFNGTYAIASITSSTVFTFTRTMTMILLSESSGTATIATSLGTSLSAYALRISSSPATATALLTTVPTLSSNGNQIYSGALGQNTAFSNLLQEDAIMVEPGQSIVITGAPTSNNRIASITVVWTEVTI